MPDWKVIEGDCVEQMAAMPEASVDSVCCDPPYGLEFMGKDWDRLDGDLPQENVWKGRRGNGGGGFADKPTVAFKGDVRGPSFGGKQHGFKRCTVCGKRQFSGSPCECEEPDWLIEHRQEAPSSSIRMQRWHEQWAREAYRVLKPGGHLLAFGGTRTYHRLACAIEDAGFEIRDTIAWMYGSGFPKSLDVSKAIDAAAGAERDVVAEVYRGERAGTRAGIMGEAVPRTDRVTAPATPDAERWQGWGTALKPAYEPIVVARKPLAGTVAANVLAHGTGALNVDGCRIGMSDADRETINNMGGFGRAGWERTPSASYNMNAEGNLMPTRDAKAHDAGRWPANVILDPDAAAMLDEQTGDLGTSTGTRQSVYGYGMSMPADGQQVGFGDSGGASRFFYCAKASSAERNAGLDGFEEKPANERHAMTGLPDLRMDREQERRTARNVHPTVKPVSLMRWLVRLVTPPDGLVLDPFAGSGTTGTAAVLEGFRFVGIEREAEYAEIARARIEWWSRHPDGVEIVKALEAERTRGKAREAGQLGLFG